MSIAALAALSFWYLRSHGTSLKGSAGFTVGLTALLALLWILEPRRTDAPSSLKREKMASFDWGMHYLRGFAIICIMMTHLWDKMGLSQISNAFLAGSTVFFLFISGYLCQYLTLKRSPSFSSFMSKKLTNVVSPFLVWTVLTLVLVLLLDCSRTGVIKPSNISLQRLPRIFLLGRAQAPYWYIPFVFFLFLVSPWLVKAKSPTLVWIFIVSLASAVVFPYRPPSRLTFKLSEWFFRFTYFSWCYIAGFLYARYKNKIDHHLVPYALPALALAFLLGLRLFAPSVIGGKPTPLTGGEGIVVQDFIIGSAFAKSLQKFFLLVPVVIVANRFRSRHIALLDALATYSFTLFFSHYFFIADYVALEHRLLGCLAPGLAMRLAIYLGLSVLFVAQNLFLAILLKMATGRWSRSFIGA